MAKGPHKIVPLKCRGCGCDQAHWGIDGVEWCTPCMPLDAVKAFTSSMTPASAMGFKAALRRNGNRALNERHKAFHESLPLLEGGTDG